MIPFRPGNRSHRSKLPGRRLLLLPRREPRVRAAATSTRPIDRWMITATVDEHLGIAPDDPAGGEDLRARTDRAGPLQPDRGFRLARANALEIRPTDLALQLGLLGARQVERQMEHPSPYAPVRRPAAWTLLRFYASTRPASRARRDQVDLGRFCAPWRTASTSIWPGLM